MDIGLVVAKNLVEKFVVFFVVVYSDVVLGLIAVVLDVAFACKTIQ